MRRKKYDEEGEKGVQDRKVGLLWCGGWRLDCCPLAHLLSRRYAYVIYVGLMRASSIEPMTFQI